MSLMMFSRARVGAVLAAGVVLSAAAGSASAQLRVASWNITNYAGGNHPALTSAIFGSFEGRQLRPDVITCQEFLSQAAVTSFLQMLNANEPGQWGAATFIDGPDTDCAFFYRISKVEFLGTTTIALGSSSTANQPRNTYRYDVLLRGYESTGAALAIYSTHMKAQGGTNDAGRRLIEAQRIRDNAEGIDTNGPGSRLPSGYRFLMGGDTNIQTSSVAEYQELVGSQPNNAGRLFDPINAPGSWNNNFAFRFVHTQDPSGAGGMDDRHDQILCGAELVDGEGLSYIGNPLIAYSTTTWDDPNHSYRAWGNDGTTFNLALATTTNSFVGPVIAQALITMAGGGGHLPIVLDLRVPAKVGSDAVIDFGTVTQGDSATQPLTVSNAGDVALWSAAGIDELDYTLSASAEFSAPAGAFVELAGGGANMHTLSMDTSTPGVKSGTVTIASDDPDQPSRVVTLMGVVNALPPACPGDADGDGMVRLSDISVVVVNWGAMATGAANGDLDGDGFVGLSDISVVVSNWGANCR